MNLNSIKTRTKAPNYVLYIFPGMFLAGWLICICFNWSINETIKHITIKANMLQILKP